MTITAVAFERAPMGSSSVRLSDFKLSLGYAGGGELGREFAGNLADDSVLQPGVTGSSVTAADDGTGRVVFQLDTPFEYTGGNLLIDMSFSNLSGSLYVWSWSAPGNRLLVGNSAYAEIGNAYSTVPVIVLIGE